MKRTIICVDDEKIVLNSLKEQLRSFLGKDINIEVSESGEDALEIIEELKNEKIDVPMIISDYIMPGMKGDELFEQIHTLYPNMIKILLTGQATIEGVANAINTAHLYRYISKPWDKNDLKLAISEGIKSYDQIVKINEQNNLLIEQNKELTVWTGAFVEAMSTTLDTRDTTTGGHSKRLAEYATKTAIAINNVNYGEYKNFNFTEDEIKELRYSALLHDIGKIGVREQILLKEQKLSDDRIIAIKYKFSLFYFILESKKLKHELDKSDEDILNNIHEYLECILKINKKDFISESDLYLIDKLAQISFDDVMGKKIILLDEFETENLKISKGNLTNDERVAINYHANLTYDILKDIPWPKSLSKIPEIASSHHEKLDGSGYFRGIKGAELSTQVKILAILDIFEALTSQDRPYKPAKSIEETLKILKNEVESGRLDGNILDIIINEKIYE